jgi:hypothetical protein
MEDEMDEFLTELDVDNDDPARPIPPSGVGGQAVLRPMVLGLIQSSYLRTHTFGEFARDVFDIVTTAASVPVAFADGFLRTFLSIESVEEDEGGRVVIRPKAGATEEDVFREVDEIAAQIEPSAIYNPVVRRQMDLVAEATQQVMQQDLQALADLSADELKSALQELEEVELAAPSPSRHIDPTDQLRERLARVRDAVRAYQAGLEGEPGDDAPAPFFGDPSDRGDPAHPGDPAAS